MNKQIAALCYVPHYYVPDTLLVHPQHPQPYSLGTEVTLRVSFFIKLITCRQTIYIFVYFLYLLSDYKFHEVRACLLHLLLYSQCL